MSQQVTGLELPEGTKVEALLNSQHYTDPLDGVATPVNFTFDKGAFNNISSEELSVLEPLVSPFDDL